jgi:hypothetical protein
MIGHDIVPHTDLTEGEHISISTASTTGSQQIVQEHLELGHIFEHFQHSSNARTLKYVTGTVENLDVNTKIFQNSALIVDIDDPFIWHANFGKQRFRDYPIISYFTTLSSHFLRGPPSC